MSIVSKKINALVTRGYEIDLMSLKKVQSTFYELSSKVKIIDFSKYFEKGTLKVLLEFCKFIRNSDYETIISADARIITWILPFISNRNNILELHQSYDGLKVFFLGIKGKMFWTARNYIYPKYKKVVVLTEEDKRKWGFNNMVVIPNFHCIQHVEELGYKRKKKIVCIGRFQKQKGYDLLIEAWKIVDKKHPDWELFYYGTIIDERSMGVIKSMKCPDSFKLKGFERSHNKIFGDAYLNVVPSRCESFALTVIEAMCFGVPTVAFDITGPRSIVSKDNGVLVESQNYTKLAGAICSLIEDEQYHDTLSSKCFIKSKEYYVDQVIQQWEKLFNSFENNNN